MTRKLEDEKQEQRNLFVAMLAVIAVLFLSKMLFPAADIKTPATREAAVIAAEDKAAAAPAPTFTVSSTDAADAVAPQPAQPVTIRSNLLSGSLTTKGGRIDNLSLTAYRQDNTPDSPFVQLLDARYQVGWQWTSTDVMMPDSSTVWQVQGDELTPFTPVQLTWQSPQVKITRTLSVDEGYLVTVQDTVTNLTGHPIRVALSGRLDRELDHLPVRSTVHEGFLGYLNGKLVEETYEAVRDDSFSSKTHGGWMGMTDKYWQSVFIFDAADTPRVDFSANGQTFSAAFQMPAETIPAGGSVQKTARLFAGAKDMDMIDGYEKSLNIPRFDLSIDFGWFYFLTRPFMMFLNWLYAMVGNMGIAILIFATLLRIALLPIATKSYESMAKMRKIQPKIKALQDRFKDDRLRLQQEMMNLYKRDKVNPASGCLPILIQIPVFFALYKVLSVSLHMRQAPFFGWIQDLSLPDPASVFTAFGYVPWPIPSFLDIGIWPVLMGLTMWIQQKLNPAPTDATQATLFKVMPVLFTFMLGNFAAGLVIYWTWSNILSILQQKYIMKKVGV